jgi:hypothetical protein
MSEVNYSVEVDSRLSFAKLDRLDELAQRGIHIATRAAAKVLADQTRSRIVGTFRSIHTTYKGRKAADLTEGVKVITYGERNDAMVNVNILNAKQPILRVLEKGSYLKGERFAFNRKGRPMIKKASRGVLPAFNFFKTAQQQAAAKMQTAVNDVLDKTIALATRD